MVFSQNVGSVNYGLSRQIICVYMYYINMVVSIWLWMYRYKKFDNLLDRDFFIGYEYYTYNEDNSVTEGTGVIAAAPHNPIIKNVWIIMSPKYGKQMFISFLLFLQSF